MVFLDGQSEDITPAHYLRIHVVKDEISQAIDDRFAFVEFVLW